MTQGCDRQLATDWLRVRKAKQAPLTQTAWDTHVEEARKAGITPAEAVAVCARESWRGFKASWDWRGAAAAPARDAPPPPLSKAERHAGAKRILGFGTRSSPSTNSQETIDV